MAAKRRDPTASGQKQIESKFRKIFAEKLEFISFRNMQAWYGRYDNVAIEKLGLAWQDYWQTTDWKPKAAPKLFAVGPVKNGYVIGRADKKKKWLY